MDTREFNEIIAANSSWISALRTEVGKVVIGQQALVDRLILSLLCKGHVLLEGVPGLAKTLSVKAMAGTLHAQFARIQFTPDLLPADLLGTMIYNPEERQFTAKKGPIFANLILADEINRAPAKVQSALLEAMQERQVTLGETTYRLPDPFLVLATQNPIDQEGTSSRKPSLTVFSSRCWSPTPRAKKNSRCWTSWPAPPNRRKPPRSPRRNRWRPPAIW